MQVAACARAPVRVWKKREKERKRERKPEIETGGPKKKEKKERKRERKPAIETGGPKKKKGRAEDLNRKRLPRLNGWLIAGLAPDVCPAA